MKKLLPLLLLTSLCYAAEGDQKADADKKETLSPVTTPVFCVLSFDHDQKFSDFSQEEQTALEKLFNQKFIDRERFCCAQRTKFAEKQQGLRYLPYTFVVDHDDKTVTLDKEPFVINAERRLYGDRGRGKARQNLERLMRNNIRLKQKHMLMQ